MERLFKQWRKFLLESKIKSNDPMPSRSKKNINAIWSLTEAPTHKFSGAGKGKVGIVIKLIDTKNVLPVLAPPEQSNERFNKLYEYIIGTSFRPKEQEYLIHGTPLIVEVVRIKKR